MSDEDVREIIEKWVGEAMRCYNDFINDQTPDNYFFVPALWEVGKKLAERGQANVVLYLCNMLSRAALLSGGSVFDKLNEKFFMKGG
jgi:hypothetical protein